MNQVKRLYRSRTNKMLGGICYGLSEYFDIDPSIVRIAWVIFTMLGGAGLLAYLICWIVVPEEPFMP
jgi:phage shock protein PspC (stress-responsive transcriptional regulator)